MSYPVRKSPRLPNYDYSSTNYYFITICTHEKKCFFGNLNQLNALGKIAQQEIIDIPQHYTGVSVDCYVVMPNHIHAIITLDRCDTSLDQIIGQYKSGVSRKAKILMPTQPLWQRSFHDHVIRSQASYEKIWNYITHNAQKWEEDRFYPGNTDK